ncbi:MAG: hypothetical protein KC636_40035, partial [Myxococcales bacterium]|nr:hypothetical protein [Myxococcales bacterium]
MFGLVVLLFLSTAGLVAARLRRELGPLPAALVGLWAAFATQSALGLALLDLERLQALPLLAGQAIALGLWARCLRSRATREPPRVDRRLVLVGLVVVAAGVGLRLAPSPYLHGGQDQGLYVNVGHHIARTGRLRPIDPLLAGQVRGARAEDVARAHKVRALPPDSPLIGVREGRWLAGLHIESARDGRLVPAFFHLLPTWFAMAELELGFARSTWPLVLFSLLSLLSMCGLGYRVVRRCGGSRAIAGAAGLFAGLALALHPLDLWISTFPVSENLARATLLGGAWLALEAEARAGARSSAGEDRSALLLSLLAGVVFGLGAFARGSVIALALTLAVLLLWSPAARPSLRRALLLSLVAVVTLAVIQAIEHSWPYFFSAAERHFGLPRLRPPRHLAAAIAAGVGGVALFGVALLTSRLEGRAEALRGRALRVGSAVAVLLALALAGVDGLLGRAPWAAEQTAGSVLARHGGLVATVLGGLGLGYAALRADRALAPWVGLGAVIALAAFARPGVRYEFYYARY